MGQQQPHRVQVKTRAITDQSWNWTARGQDNTKLPGRVDYFFITTTCNQKIRKQEAIAQVEYTTTIVNQSWNGNGMAQDISFPLKD